MAKKLGFLVAANPSDWDQYIKWFTAKLAKLRTDVNITFLPSNGADGDRIAIQKAAEDLAKTSDVIVTSSTQAALACKKATQTNQTPFVFASVGDPAISQLIPTPGGNFTGGSNQQVKLVPQRVDQMLNNNFQGPFAVVGNYNIEPIKSAMDSALKVLKAKGMQAQLAPLIPGGPSIDTFISGLKNQKPSPIKSLYVCSDMFITSVSTTLNKKARAAGMKTMFEFSEHVTKHGGDFSYGIKFQSLFEKAAEYVDIILSSSTTAGDLPIFEPPPSDRELKKKSRRSQTKKRRSQTKKKSRRGR